MGKIINKKIFKHGGSFAIDLPMEYIKNIDTTEIVEEIKGDIIIIRPKQELDSIEREPYFKTFVQALAIDAMKHPEKLHKAEEVWDEEWENLLDGVTDDEE